MTRNEHTPEVTKLRQEIDDLKVAEKGFSQLIKELEQSKERYRTIYNNTPVMLHSIDRDGRLVSVSDYWLEVMGYDRSEVIGRLSTDFLTEDCRIYASEVVLPRFFKSGEIKNVPYQFVKKDGGIIHALLSAISERNEFGEISRTLAVLLDVTDRLRAEEELRESEEKYRDLFYSAYDIIILLDVNGNILDINRSGEMLTGYNRNKLLQMNVFDHLIVQEDQKIIRKVIKKATLDQSSTYQIRWMTKTGKVIHLEGSTTGRLSKLGEFISTRCIMRDVTEKVKAGERIRKLAHQLAITQEEERRRISKELHDDLGQALTAINFDLLHIEKTLPPETDQIIRDKILEAKTLANEVDEKISEITLILHPPMLDDLGLVPTLKWYISQFSKRTHLQVKMDIQPLEERPPELVEIVIYRVAQEAFRNIAKHAQASSVCFQLVRESSSILVTIEDNGIGFDINEMKNERNPERGAGLFGMSERISSLHGSIAIESQLEKGTRIEFKIPLDSEAEKVSKYSNNLQ